MGFEIERDVRVDDAVVVVVDLIHPIDVTGSDRPDADVRHGYQPLRLLSGMLGI